MLGACTGAFALLIHNAPYPPKGVMEKALTGGFLAFLLAFAVFTAIFPLLRWISASEDGLRIPRRRILWREIADFYEVVPSNHDSGKSPTLILQLADGRKLRLAGAWTNREAFRDIVARRATAARVRRWGLKGSRPEDDWPRPFDYKTPTNRFGFPVATAALIGVLILLLVLLGRGAFRYAHEVGLLWGVGFFFTGFLAMGAKVALYLYLTLSLQKELQRRRDHRLVLSANGLLFTDRNRRIAATWEEITDYEITQDRGAYPAYRVVTKNGAFDFTAALKESAVVRAVIARNAPVGDGKWSSRASDALVTIKTSPGVTVHHYRTLPNRTMLYLPTALVLMTPLPTLLRRSFDASATLSAEFPFVFAGAALATVWLWACYFRSRIEWDDEGITQLTVFGIRRRLRWKEITHVRLASEESGPVNRIYGRNACLRYGSHIGDSDVLRKEIERRVPTVA